MQKAIDEVNQIIETLKETLDEMDEVLETLELAERQKNADEQEIESLRRALRGLQRPREHGGQREHPREHPREQGSPRESGPRDHGGSHYRNRH